MLAVTLTDTEVVFSIAEKAATVAALVVGACFAYFKFVKDRVYRPRLDFDVRAGRVKIGSVHFLFIRTKVKNFGTSKIKIFHRDSGLLVYNCITGADMLNDYDFAGVQDYRAYGDVYAQHDYVESGESITHDALVRVPADRDTAHYVVCRLIVFGRRRLLGEQKLIECVGGRIVLGTTDWPTNIETPEQGDAAWLSDPGTKRQGDTRMGAVAGESTAQ